MNDPTKRSVADLVADLDASDAEAEAGDLVPAQTVFARIEAAIERIEASGEPAPKRKAGPKR